MMVSPSDVRVIEVNRSLGVEMFHRKSSMTEINNNSAGGTGGTQDVLIKRSEKLGD